MSHTPLPSSVRFHLFRAGRPVPNWMLDVAPKTDGSVVNIAEWNFANKNGRITFTRTCIAIAVAGHCTIIQPVDTATNKPFSDSTSLLTVTNHHDAVLGANDGATGICFIMDPKENSNAILQSYLNNEVSTCSP